LPEPTYPGDLRYHDQHGWVRLGDDDSATLGITWFAQDSLGEVVFFEPPELGTTLNKGTPYTEVESVKATSDVIAPVSGEVVAVNDALADSPEKINEDPYGAGWLVKVKLSHPDEAAALLSAADYQQQLHG
jgi:glycine cleavage system H protein